jgi:hypothetical protein
MTEQLRLEERVWDAGAVDRHERAVRAVASLVNKARHDFFADPALARNEDLGARSRGAENLLVDFAHRGADSDQALRDVHR